MSDRRTSLRREKADFSGTELHPGAGRGPGQREPLLSATAWTPAFAGEQERRGHQPNSPWMNQPGNPPRPSPIRPSR
jgi:hypothetical protein